MNVLMDANLEKMKACLEVTEASLGKMEAMIRAGQEQMGIKIMTGLEEMKATVRSLSREDTGHCGAL
jgi:archaellum component FlaC